MGFVTNRQDATIGWHVKFVKAGSMPAVLKSRKNSIRLCRNWSLAIGIVSRVIQSYGKLFPQLLD